MRADRATPVGSRIIRNAAQCARCKDIVESMNPNDEMRCTCGAIAVNGGRHCLKRSFFTSADFIDLAQVIPVHE